MRASYLSKNMGRLATSQFRGLLLPQFRFATSQYKCKSAQQLNDSLNPVVLANLSSMEQLIFSSRVGLQYFNFLLDCFAETQLLQEQPDLKLLEVVLAKLSDPATYKGQIYTQQETSNYAYRVTKSFLRLTTCTNKNVLKMVDNSYPVFTRFSKYLLETANLVADENLKEIYQLTENYLNQEHQSPYLTFMLEEFSVALSQAIADKQQLITQAQRKQVLSQFIGADIKPYLDNVKIEVYSRTKNILKIRTESGRVILLYGNINNANEDDFEVLEQLFDECSKVPIMVTEDQPIRVQQKAKQNVQLKDELIPSKDVSKMLQAKIEYFESLGYKSTLEGEDLKSFMEQFINDPQYEVELEQRNVWNKHGPHGDKYQFNPLATAYLTYIDLFQSNIQKFQNAKLQINLIDLPKEYLNNELIQNYTKKDINNLLELCKYTQLLEVVRYLNKYQNQTSLLPCPTCNKNQKNHAPPLPKGYLNVLQGDNVYRESKKNDHFIKRLSEIIKQRSENIVVVTSQVNFYQAAALAISEGQHVQLFGQQIQSKYDFTNTDLEVGRKEYLRYLSDIAGVNATNSEEIQEFFEKSTILEVLQSVDSQTGQQVSTSQDSNLYEKYKYMLSFQNVLETLPEKERQAIGQKTKQYNDKCFLDGTIFTSGAKRQVSAKKGELQSANQEKKQEFLQKLSSFNRK